ncbi:hypothetical protein CR205_18035 [Alteribacter lacisalsi]|uniref:Uncharacterized protein n=1 Tax=Alteribacter lacisalsi TaxID=2045244 RepID=A0A2W0H353_9BACI|nr:hypothetical protein [Alteribacter lacisalsi]PYZ96253.1 hypothetical protein CR205_18035 [Alteribacter lacisalsi]
MICLCENPLESIHLQLADDESPVACSLCGNYIQVNGLPVDDLVKKSVNAWFDAAQSQKVTTAQANEQGHTLVYRLQAALHGKTIVYFLPLPENDGV